MYLIRCFCRSVDTSVQAAACATMEFHMLFHWGFWGLPMIAAVKHIWICVCFQITYSSYIFTKGHCLGNTGVLLSLASGIALYPPVIGYLHVNYHSYSLS